ncbi:MAG: DNA polymerase III subunit gamma/tau [Gammaproteobacteria bacterium]|nr:DNA polymerase III subunit gamma/tau [Gammaproteobacteria bacterium]
MNYQVLARKWRPDSFETLVGQSHVIRALTNALNNQRLHHAYLFTGTRGVGKTTFGRILAKCLNCEIGITSKPCNQCSSCKAITSGRFIDLIEVDAASRTKVEDTRELLENVAYAPTSGRFKVYLIDEVHMLSTHSFNALLKTLEEPPPHVKFFLATTDPQKLPITVLSRCLQFHLKCLAPELITQRLADILQQENLPFEEEALTRLAYAAEGSMRDALSLLDQAIAFSNGNISVQDIKMMLSTIEATYIYEILDALAEQHAQNLIALTHSLAEKSIDFTNALEELLSLLHQIAIAQFVKESDVGAWDKDKIQQFSRALSPEDVQLFYQIALIGRKDLPLAPTPRIGFEMVLLRMLAFHPSSIIPPTKNADQENKTPIAPKIESRPEVAEHVSDEPLKVPASAVTTKTIPNLTNDWQEILPHLNLTGMTAALASHCVVKKMTNDEIVLAIDPTRAVLLNKKQEERVGQALRDYFQRSLQLTIQTGELHMDTPAARDQHEQSQRKSAAEESIQKDPNVQKMIEMFDAKILPGSIEKT